MEYYYAQTVASLPEGYSGQNAKLYPGSVLSIGISNDNVRDLQTYLSFIGRYYAEIPEIPVTGYYGTQTRDAVRAFQSLFGINPTGAVGPVTWNTIASQYDFLVSTESRWIQLCDFKGWKNTTVEEQNIQSLPSNILLTPNKQIIERNIRGQKLIDKIKQLTKDDKR